MRLWRLCSERWAAQAFDGEGARVFGGRWNHVGTPVVYCSGSLSLATLEILVHVEPRHLREPHAAFPVDVPSSVRILHIGSERLPPSWRRVDAVPPELQTLGTEWVRTRSSAVLGLPSIVVPHELNFLLNPAHPDFDQLVRHPPVRYLLDPRLPHLGLAAPPPAS